MRKKHIVIAHRGASGYLPEHTTAGKAAAHMMDPDMIEQDISISADGRAIVIHDYLDNITNVKSHFPSRRRPDGHYHVIDFTLKELKTLSLHERINPETGDAVYTGRFPVDTCVEFFLHTLDEELELIQGMNKTRKKNIGICPELKMPRFHRENGFNIAEIVLGVLAKYGYDGQNCRCLLQCFDPECIRYMRDVLKTRIPIMQLIADNSWRETDGVDYRIMQTGRGLDEVAEYCAAIGPWTEQIVTVNSDGSFKGFTDLAALAHQRNLEVHAFTARADALPSYAPTVDDLFRLLYLEGGVDGLFTDFPDLAADFLKRQGCR